MKYFKYSDFTLQKLQKLKKSKGVSIGVCLPVLNEVQTLKKVVKIIKNCCNLIDEIIIIDSGSNDGSIAEGESEGILVIKDILSAKEMGVKLRRGKGWNLWTSLYYLNTDIIIWIDSDTKNFSKKFVTGLLGPLLVDDSIKFIKGFYKRPKGDSRVTEILVRPFLNFFFPKTKNIIQPLSGEYGGYRKFLEKIYFYSGYSVEVTILLQALYTLNVNEIAQVYLGKRIHPLQSINSLGQMGAAILKTLLLIAQEFGIVNIRKTPANILRQFEMVKETPKANDIIITDYRLSPIITLKSYRKKFKSRI